jgi:hypothetical protein
VSEGGVSCLPVRFGQRGHDILDAVAVVAQSIRLLSRKKCGSGTPAYPVFIDRLKTTICSASRTLSTGMPAIGLLGSSVAPG